MHVRALESQIMCAYSLPKSGSDIYSDYALAYVCAHEVPPAEDHEATTSPIVAISSTVELWAGNTP